MTVTGTDGLDGTLTWTLFGPVDPGPERDVRATSTGTAPRSFATGTVPISDDGTYRHDAGHDTERRRLLQLRRHPRAARSTPTTRSARSASPARRSSLPATPTIATVINADGYSDDVTITGTVGFDGVLTWTLFGPVAAGPSGTCDDADWAGAAAFATGTVPIAADGTVHDHARPRYRPPAAATATPTR